MAAIAFSKTLLRSVTLVTHLEIGNNNRAAASVLDVQPNEADVAVIRDKQRIPPTVAHLVHIHAIVHHQGGALTLFGASVCITTQNCDHALPFFLFVAMIAVIGSFLLIAIFF
jgi:hypothetical protein